MKNYISIRGINEMNSITEILFLKWLQSSSFETNEFHPTEKNKKDTSHLYPEREGDNGRLQVITE